MIIMLTGSHCSHCTLLKGRLDAEGLEFIPVDVKSAEGEAFVTSLNVRTIPILIKKVEGKAIMTLRGSDKTMSAYKEFFND
jgi:glutaredoxin